MNIAGIMAKYFATSLAIENVVNAPRVISNCLPISTISISFVGSESRSTILAASLAACVPEFIATPTSACASAGASFVPSPVIAISRPDACSRSISAIFVSGRACARKSSTPASRALAHVRLEDVFEVDDAGDAAGLCEQQWRAAAARDALDLGRKDVVAHAAVL